MKDLCMREYTILNDTNKGEVQKGGTSEIRPSKWQTKCRWEPMLYTHYERLTNV